MPIQIVVSESQAPMALSYIDFWERGVDPWHPDSFVGTPMEGVLKNTAPRKGGWQGIDYAGNIVAWHSDGETVEVPDKPFCSTCGRVEGQEHIDACEKHPDFATIMHAITTRLTEAESKEQLKVEKQLILRKHYNFHNKIRPIYEGLGGVTA